MYKNLNDYQIMNYSRLTKKELMQQLDWMQGSLNKANYKDDIGGCYIIEVYKNKIPVQTLKFDWDTNPHGAKFSEVKELADTLMRAYQDYNSLIETRIILLEDWDELPAGQKEILDSEINFIKQL